MKRIVLIGIVLALGGALVGCGDDAEALTKEEYLKQGNTICADGQKKLDAAFEKAFGDLGEGEEPDPKVIADLLDDELIPNIQAQIDAIRDLAAPEDLKDDAEQLVDHANAALDSIRDQAKDDPAAVFESEEDPFADVNIEAGKMGLTVCADP